MLCRWKCAWSLAGWLQWVNVSIGGCCLVMLVVRNRLLHQCVLIQFAVFFALKSRASRAVRGQGSALPGQACEFGHRCCLPWMSGAWRNGKRRSDALDNAPILQHTSWETRGGQDLRTGSSQSWCLSLRHSNVNNWNKTKRQFLLKKRTQSFKLNSGDYCHEAEKINAINARRAELLREQKANGNQ